jgi:hypothetical protein
VIDWLTLRLAEPHLPARTLLRLRNSQDVLARFTGDGAVTWRGSPRQDLCHGIYKLHWRLNGHGLEISGSPARVSLTNNVFGDRDPRRSALNMVRFFEEHARVALSPNVVEWKCSKLAVTLNYALQSADDVKRALRGLAVAGGPRNMSTEGDTVYWNRRSKTRSGMAYHKGPELAHTIAKGLAAGCNDQLTFCQRILRLELTLGAQFWRERARQPWHQWSAEELEAENRRYFATMIAAVTTVAPSDAFERLREVTGSKTMALAVYHTLLEIQADGLDIVRSRMAPSTFHKHKKVLFRSGMTWADLHQQSPRIRQPLEIGEPIHDWIELSIAA